MFGLHIAEKWADILLFNFVLRLYMFFLGKDQNLNFHGGQISLLYISAGLLIVNLFPWQIYV